jgi:chromosome segregation ATPase
MSKYKATGCARFFFFLVVFVPIAYFGAQYLMNSGKWDQIRDKIENVTEDKNSVEKAIDEKNSDLDINTSAIEERLTQLLDKIKRQDQLIKDQGETIHKQNVLIDQLKQQLGQPQAPAESTTTPNSSPQTEQGTSLEDLLKEADKALKKN